MHDAPLSMEHLLGPGPVTCSGKKIFNLLPVEGKEHQWSTGYDVSLACYAEGRHLYPGWMYFAVVPALAGTCGKGAAAKVLGRAKTTCYDLEAESSHGLVAMTSA